MQIYSMRTKKYTKTVEGILNTTPTGPQTIFTEYHLNDLKI